ncbi:protein canopy homolog 2-like [Sycon ciliatum]|uniref:protein canopy homolog 2-like n=1 Tax=Sycon ciliatum TaxID=27933 RepID=UPI0020A9C722|eukprot:scpid13561/ scgid17430/ Protein canopy homolog 2; MIR-interacting saposin-like protein; Putative secreted protein ZSIG9; Transmembrane protein 4
MRSVTAIAFAATLMLLVCVHVAPSRAEKEMDLYCAACHMLVDELFFARKVHNPKKKIEVGSFRLDPSGKTHTKSIDFLTSEAYLTELLEDICGEAENYIQNTNPDGSRIFRRMQSRDGTPLGLNNITYNPDALRALRHYCDNTVEVYEEQLLELFRNNHPDIKNHFCMDVTKYCDKTAEHPFAAVDRKKEKDEEKARKREERKRKKLEKEKAKKATKASITTDVPLKKEEL